MQSYPDTAFRPSALQKEIRLCADDDRCQLTSPVVAAIGPANEVLLGGLSSQLVLVDSSGSVTRPIGRPGNGPGEYRWVIAAGFDDRGHIKIFDTGTIRLTTFDTNGNLVKTTRVPPPPPALTGATIKGGVLYVLSVPPSPAGGDSATGSILRFVENEKRYQEIGRKTVRSFAISGMDGMRLPDFFAPPELWDIARNGELLWHSGSSYSFDRYNAQGALVSIVTIQTRPTPVGRADVDREFNVRLGRPPYPPGIEQQLREAANHAADVFPAVDQLVTGRDGVAWFRRYAPASADSARWDSFVGGTPSRAITLPSTARIIAAATQHRLLIMELDELDVPIIHWYRVVDH